MKKICFTLFLGMVFFGGGMSAEAYGVLDESAVRLDASRVLYVMTFEFGFLNAETYMPMNTFRTGRPGNASTSIQYSLVSEDGTVFDEGITRAVVLSSTALREGEYFSPYGKKATFTLLALIDMGERAGENVRVDIDSIPLTIVRKNSTRESMFLSGEELKGFETRLLSL
jgi:hypothetical protein